MMGLFILWLSNQINSNLIFSFMLWSFNLAKISISEKNVVNKSIKTRNINIDPLVVAKAIDTLTIKLRIKTAPKPWEPNLSKGSNQSLLFQVTAKATTATKAPTSQTMWWADRYHPRRA